MAITETYEQESKLVNLLEAFAEKKLYGEVVVKFNAGKVVQIRRTESIELKAKTKYLCQLKESGAVLGL